MGAKWLQLCFVFGGTILSAQHAIAERCGPQDCEEGSTCCNYGCGICAPPSDACTSAFCPWGRPTWIDPDHSPGVDEFDRLGASFVLARYKSNTKDDPGASLSGMALRLRLGRRLGPQLGLQAQIAGSMTLDEKGPAPDGQGYVLALGLRRRLPQLFDWIAWAFMLDGELRDSPPLLLGLGPVLPQERMGALSAGIALGDVRNAVPLTAHLRYTHAILADSANIGMLEFGLGLSTELGRYLFWFDGQPVPFGCRIHYRLSEELTGGRYRAHEFGGGFYYFDREIGLRVGIDVDRSFQRLAHEVEGRALGVLSRVDWFWDANF